ncbi:MAG: 30S ribosomal protein S8 [Candidatus Zixiibacteriota bacterium]
MVMTDPVADLLTRIRNAMRAGHEKADAPHSKIKEEIVKILKDEGFITNYRVIEDKPAAILRVYMKYGPDKTSVLRRIERISRPGRRVYAGKDEVPRVISGMGVAVISTSQGVLTDRECRRRGIGGEVLLRAW